MLATREWQSQLRYLRHTHSQHIIYTGEMNGHAWRTQKWSEGGVGSECRKQLNLQSVINILITLIWCDRMGCRSGFLLIRCHMYERKRWGVGVKRDRDGREAGSGNLRNITLHWSELEACFMRTLSWKPFENECYYLNFDTVLSPPTRYAGQTYNCDFKGKTSWP